MNGKARKWLACAVGCIGIAVLLAAALLSPTTSRSGVEAVALSRASGFYDAPFDLELRCGNGRIYYTLDSADPDETSTLYEGPIHISDASGNPNVYSMNTDVSLEFRPELLAYSGQEPRFGYETPDSPVDKATVVKAVAIDDEGNRSDVAVGVYFVGFGEKTGYEGRGIIAVTTDPKNLFDFETGIYVTGKALEDKLVDGHYKQKTSAIFEGWPANYNRRGIEWEREAAVCIFDEDRNLVLSGSYGIRTQGGVSRGMLPKSLNLFARKRYGQPAFDGQLLFGESWQLGSVTLTTGSESHKNKMHDCLVNALVSDLAFDTRLYKPYELFLDGEYWGVYWLTPRYEKEYFQSKYGVDGDDVVMIKDGKAQVGTEEDVALYDGMRAFIVDNDMSDPELYARACAMIDVQSCIDYYAAEVYICNLDWPQKNVGLWRTRGTNDGGAYGDGVWRWALYDVNVAMAYRNAELDYLPRVLKRDALFASLMENRTFAAAFYTRMVELAERQFNPDRVEAWIRDYEVFMQDAMENDYARFFNGKRDGAYFINSCEQLLRFFQDRSAYILDIYGTG